MDDSAKYLIHAAITTDGVVERSDVVGAVFGQTEGLLGDEMDLRDLQQGSKVGRIDVEVTSEGGQSTGTLNVATSMDKVETAILAASLETIERVGPCRATVTVDRIEDVRAAKRREVVDRARELLATGFDETVLTSHELVRKVRESARVEDITEYAGYPAGPNAVNSDAIILVEGRADVLTLLRYGIKNAVAVEGTNVPDEIAALTAERTVTAFLDGDRGGELILKELGQVADVDYVAFAPAGRSVEDLDREEVRSTLRTKVPFETVAGASSPIAAAASTTTADSPAGEGPVTTDGHAGTTDGGMEPANAGPNTTTDHPSTTTTATTAAKPVDQPESPVDPGTDVEPDRAVETDELSDPEDADETDAGTSHPETIADHAEAVIGEGTGQLRALDGKLHTVTEVPASDALEALTSIEESPHAVVMDGTLTQRVLDVAAERGVEQLVTTACDELTKRPTSVRIRTADQLQMTTKT